MTSRYRNILLAAAVLLALAILAAWPFLTRPGLPRDTDAELHVFRAAQLGEALRGGAGYVRWAPDLWYGYGYPIFNYYPPLTYYLANLLTLAGLDIVAAVKAVFVLGLLGAAAGMYVFARENWGERAGIVAAAAYVFSPYILFIDPYMRGDLAECFALALFPWLLWAFRAPNVREAWRMAASRGKGQMAASRGGWPFRMSNIRAAAGVVSWAALILTHPVMSPVLSAMLVAWLLWQMFAVLPAPVARPSSFALRSSSFAPRPSLFTLHSSLFVLRPSSPALAPLRGFVFHQLALVLGLSAVYWLPFVLERGAIRLSVVGPGQFDFHNHFVAWRDLFAASPTLDLGATVLKYIRNLGLAQWLLALLAIPVVIRFRREPQARLVLFFVLCSLALIFLLLSPSAFIWERVPLMSYVQFPWRLLGPTAGMLAVCAGAGVSHLKFQNPKVKWAGEWIAAVTLLAILGLALPTMYPPGWNADFGPTTPRDILQVELKGRWLGTTSTGDFIPSTVKSDPPPDADLIASYDRGAVDKFDHSSLPQGASVSVVEHGPTHDRFTVTSPQPFVARVLTFDFPGWRATVDDQPAPIVPSDPNGLITFPVPAGSHDLCVEFGSTPPRTAGAIISVATLMILAWLVVKQVAGRGMQDAGRGMQDAGRRMQDAGGRTQEGEDEEQEGECEEQDARSAGGRRQDERGKGQEAEGKRQEARGAEHGTPEGEGEEQDARSAGGKGQEASSIPGFQYQNSKVQWIALIVVAAFALVKIGFVDRCVTCFRIVSPPGQALVAQHKIDPQVTPSDWAHTIALLGFDLPQQQVRAGGSFPLTLYWKAIAPVHTNYQVFVHLVSPRDKLWGQPLHDKLNPGDFPTTRWPLDKYVWDDYVTPDSVVRVRPDTPPGDYTILVGLYTLADGARAPVFGALGQPAGDAVILPVKVQVLPAR